MVDYAIANQIRPFQLPDIAGIAGAMQGLELNRMRSQQLQGAEQERNALRQYLSSPDVDIMSPETTRRVLAIAPTIGGPALQAATAARREAAQTQTAELERTIKYIEKYRNQLPGVTAETYPALRARILRDAPGSAHMLRGFEGFEGTPYFDRTAFRAGFGSDTTTLADGTVVPVRQGMTVNREDAERDLARRIPEFTQRAERNIGAENFARLPPNAQAALISIAYNYGHIPESLLPAARSGDLTALSQAVAALPANPSRRQSEAAVIAGQGPRLVQANAMVPGATPANAMLAPPDATVVPRPLSPVEFPGLPRAASLSDADLFRRIRDVQQKEAEALMLADVQRQTAAARAAEAGQTSESQTRGRLTAEQERENRRKQEGRENIEKVLEDMKASYQRLEELRGIPSERRGAAANIPAYLGATPPGQELGKALATPSQSQRNALQASGRQLLTAIKAATGMSAQEMNSNVELQQLMAAISSPTQSIESVREILTRISRNYGSGRLEFGAPAETPAAAAPAPAAAAPRDGVPSQRRGAAAPAGRPTLEQFLERARPANPNASVEDLTAYYNRTYGGR